MSSPNTDTNSQARDNDQTPRPSRPPSVFSAASMDTLVADTSYRGFPSREAYLRAFTEWANSQKYYTGDEQLRGFYGTRTLENYLNRPDTGRADASASDMLRRATVARVPTVTESNTTSAIQAPEPAYTKDEPAKANRLRRVFSRRKTVA
ncbi:hypothetical protein HRR83_006340 [Exophiala dermatitidis]|uniref:Uncharacterized protein n=1 Tax=Exophiala dermatitidis TaxID=5970 RepID=A0AAN6ERG4_EXODE|nr:hypothetical protein HRR73_007198 [Exophiala dermatitidis]KAJ4509531.1 hypothetical protein HRR74_007312 [Exophiala dermatitidis]KAJ4530532.1 hypothetical protein HRR76_008240 [Exophiala dermatitidis]KAJ4545300.1 hypothetical protein HRR77_005148 [Exophiala dermatitidis]KAJ4551401.1 hypothetical protein HRR78_004078 [Exophiala dermatitidis]